MIMLSFPPLYFCALVAATGLDRYVLTGTPAHAQPYLRRVVNGLPPSLRSLIGETAVVVGDAVLSSRT